MSIVNIRAALEGALNGMSPALQTAWDNAPFVPTTGTAYQQVSLLLAEPDNSTFGANHVEIGIFQISLRYPLQTGSSAAATRAELIRTTFARGNTFTSGGNRVVINKTPEISAGTVDGDRWNLNVSIRFFVQI